jgi:hypothetical protein
MKNQKIPEEEKEETPRNHGDKAAVIDYSDNSFQLVVATDNIKDSKTTFLELFNKARRTRVKGKSASYVG